MIGINEEVFVLEEIIVRMAVDPIRTVKNALSCSKKLKFPNTMVSVDYDDEADVLYVRFKHAKIVDNDSLDDEGLVIASLDVQGKVVGLVISQASRFNEG